VALGAQFLALTDTSLGVALRSAARDQLPWAIFTPLMFRFVNRFFLQRANWPRRLFVHLLVCVGVLTLCQRWENIIDPTSQSGLRAGGPGFSKEVESELQRPARPPPGEEPRPGIIPKTPIDLVHLGTYQLPVYLMIMSAAHAFLFYRANQERAASLTKARLEALKVQLQPHFLFNTLNSIAELLHLEPDKADAMLTSLSQLLRLTLEAPSDQLVPLERELHFLNRYLVIMQTRFEHRLQFEFDIAPETRQVLIFPLLLQPLVENAIRHGVSSRPDGGAVTISASTSEARLRLSIRDNGRGLPKGEPLREGVGITNTRARLQEFYGSEATLLFRNHEGLKVEITLPLRQAT
jgi:two-component sensor histidine kinase